jgi:hypothetical protein
LFVCLLFWLLFQTISLSLSVQLNPEAVVSQHWESELFAMLDHADPALHAQLVGVFNVVVVEVSLLF